jgi:hypothetical protein
MLQKYFTIWILILVIFYKLSSKIFSLPFLTFIILFMGLYISYINPTKYFIEYKNKIYIIDGFEKNLLDIYLHIFPFLFIYLKFGIEPFFNNIKIIPSLLLIILYNLLYCPNKLYHLPNYEIFLISALSLISYILLYYFYTIYIKN